MTAHHTRTKAGALAVWLPGLLVAVGACVATAHGLYEVAVAARVPVVIAWLYPLITDGLALVAYGATARLSGAGRRYAWLVVVLAAGLSGLAQASYLAGSVAVAPPVLRFGVGAWPALAAAIVAHLLFLLGTHSADARTDTAAGREPVHAEPVRPAPVQAEALNTPPVQPQDAGERVQPPAPTEAVQPRSNGNAVRPDVDEAPTRPVPVVDPVADVDERPASPAKDRARAAARLHASQHGDLPTVSQLMEIADVARGTAGTALKELREHHTHLTLIHETHETTEARTHA